MKKIWVNKTNSFKNAEKFDYDYYLNMTTSKRLETMQLLREIYPKIKKGYKSENREGLRRVIKVIQ